MYTARNERMLNEICHRAILAKPLANKLEIILHEYKIGKIDAEDNEATDDLGLAQALVSQVCETIEDIINLSQGFEKKWAKAEN
ncbi:MAG: hypothetical protein F9K32_04520 [Desulfobulbaceae bacterium]|nr:MAG: hypothetical protein F9K32_04520 [Desulfobulbaceae bacterium]